jgi:preprotein translocase subunit YajC
MYIKNHPEICDVVADIASGMHDDNLEQIKAEFDLVIRRRQVAYSLQEIAVGDRVQITGRMNPKYLTGLTGTVTEVNHKRGCFFIDVDQDHPNLAAAKKKRSEVGIPLGCVSKIEA